MAGPIAKMSTDSANLVCTVPLLDLACTCAKVRRAARATTLLYDAVLSPSGVRISQFIVLRVIDRLGSASPCQLSEAMAIAAETLSRRLDLMRRSGWIDLRVGKDKRQKVFSLTEAGRMTLESALPYWRKAQRRLEMVMDRQQMEEIQRDLDLLAKASLKAMWARLSTL